MPVVLEAVTFGASGRKRQNRIEPIESLNGSFFIDAEYSRVLRRVQVQTENVGRFAFELGIIAGQVTFQAVGLQTGLLHTRCTASSVTPSAAASLRQLQCVESSVGFFRVADKIRARNAGVTTVAF